MAALRLRSACLGVALLMAVPAWALDQPRRGRVKWWQSEHFRQELGLTSDQSARLEEIFQSILPELRSAKQELDRLDAELSTMLAAPGSTESDVSAQVDRVEAARSRLSKVRTLMLFRMHKLLSPEQRLKLRALHNRDRDDHGRDQSRGRRQNE